MIKPTHLTNLEIKKAALPVFIELIEDQLQYGGTKYQATDEKEATDVICEVFGLEWRLGEMMKRILRFRNVRRERDLLKLAAEAFLVWVQMGFHEVDDTDHDADTWNEKGES